MLKTLDAFIKRKRLIQAYKDIFDGDQGKLVLEDLSAFCKHNGSSLYASPKDGKIDPLVVAALEGRREVFLKIAKMIKMNLSEFDNLIKEQHDE